VAAQIALRIDALNGEPGQILHNLSPPAALCGCETANKTPFQPKRNVGANCGSADLWCQEKMPQDIGVPLPPGGKRCRRPRAAAIFPRRRRNLRAHRRNLM
jgi:hypothetical protein